jgi:thymidylate synthase
VGTPEYDLGRLAEEDKGVCRMIVYSPRRYEKIIKYIMNEGATINPRGMTTKEVINASILVRDPLDRLIFSPARKMNVGFAIADWLQIMTGNNELDFLSHFAKNIEMFADPEDKNKVGGAYGPRIVQPEGSQVQGVINRLQADPNSRQAVMTIYDGRVDLGGAAHVVPCTLSLQFLVRGKRLHSIVTMRSNDIVWGLTYDVFMFTMIQEYVARQLDLEPGDYYHNAGSLHLYVDRDKELVKASSSSPRVNMKMAPMPKDIDISRIYGTFWDARDLTSREFWANRFQLKTRYEQDLASVARFWAARKAGEKYEAKASYDSVKDPALRKMLRFWPVV